MPPDNSYIAGQFSLLAKVMDIHGENSFKSKSYSIAAYNIENLPVQLSEVSRDRIFAFKGIGENIGKKIIEILEKEELPQLTDLLQRTPPGVLDMLKIKGLGPKKISTIWKEMEIESLGELLYACNENRLMLIKGFGDKTQKNVQEAIEFFQKNQGIHLYAQVEQYARAIDARIKQAFTHNRFELSGDFRRQLEVINKLEWVTTASMESIMGFFETLLFRVEFENEDDLTLKGPEGVSLQFHITDDNSFVAKLFETSASAEFLQYCRQLPGWFEVHNCFSEEQIFGALKLPYIPPPLREYTSVFQKPVPPTLIEHSDIKGLVHCHSDWSDGSHSIEELAEACLALNLQYLVMSDHSKSAFYANGLREDRIREQHRYIDELNEKCSPFRIFKSIECDILSDGSLDYSNDVLASFDLVIASIHSNLKMSEPKATKRLLKAIENPYTTILGHMTGRLLLSRNGYPVDYESIIQACADNNVVIELNANPRRLDMDWRWISHAAEKGVLISIDPDAHYIHGFDDLRYGVLSAQKGGLTKTGNLSSFTLREFEEFLLQRKKLKGI
jgi:DNA polymerase (family 10)